MTTERTNAETTGSTEPPNEPSPIRVEMNDGSVYTIDDEQWLRAFDQKYGDRDREAVLDSFREAVAEHWSNRTKPWKGITLEWGSEPTGSSTDEPFEDQADLASEVMYASLRAPLMAMAMRDLRAADGKPVGGPHVIGIGDDGVVAYTGEEMIEYDSLDPLLSEAEEE